MEVDPPRPEAGDIVTVRVVLYNAGPVDVVDVTVTMPGSEDEVMASIAREGEATATFVWVAEGRGRARLSGEVRFGPGEHSVAWEREVDVRGEAGGVAASWTIAVALVIAIVVLVLLVSMRHGRVRGGTDPVEALAEGRDRAE